MYLLNKKTLFENEIIPKQIENAQPIENYGPIMFNGRL
jgi:hypothetical protein